MIKVNWYAYLRMFLIGYALCLALTMAGYSQTVVLIISCVFAICYPEQTMTFIPRTDNDDKK